MTTDHELLSGIVNVKPVIVSDAPDAHQVWLDIGCQHFTVGEYQETKDEAEFIARQLRIALGNIQPIVIKEMVNRFLGWKLPEDFAPDDGISFVRNEFHDRHGMPTGTNLLHAGQAKAMFEHCVEGIINSGSKSSSNSIDTPVAPSPKVELDGNRVYLDLVLIGWIVEQPDGLKFKTNCYDILSADELRAIAGKLDALNIGLSGAAVTKRDASNDPTPLVSRLLDSAQITTLDRWVMQLFLEAAEALIDANTTQPASGVTDEVAALSPRQGANMKTDHEFLIKPTGEL